MTDQPISHYAVCASRVGPVAVVFTERGLRAVTPISRLARRGRGTVGSLVEVPLPEGWDAPLRLTLEEGRLSDLPLDHVNMSSFRRKVMAAAAKIDRGNRATYADIAAAAGRPGAVRAATSALVHNPLPLVVPCHRIVTSEDELGDYVLGTDLKQQLLAGEAAAGV